MKLNTLQQKRKVITAILLTFLFVQFLSPPIYAQENERLDTKEITCNKAWFDDFKEISDTEEKIKAIGLKILYLTLFENAAFGD